MSVKNKEEGEAPLIPHEILLTAGVQIGSRIKVKQMQPYIFKIRSDSIPILNLKEFDRKLRIAAKLITKFKPSQVVVVSGKHLGKTPVEKFCELTETIPITGRFMPGTFSNPQYSERLSPHLVVITDPLVDKQAIKEASIAGIPVIAIADTDCTLKNIDLVIPANNKGKRSLALIYWLLAREVLRERGVLSQNTDLKVPVEEFETKEE